MHNVSNKLAAVNEKMEKTTEIRIFPLVKQNHGKKRVT